MVYNKIRVSSRLRSSFDGVRTAAMQKGWAETRRPHVAISGEAARMNFLAVQGKTSTSLLGRPFHPGRTV